MTLARVSLLAVVLLAGSVASIAIKPLVEEVIQDVKLDSPSLPADKAAYNFAVDIYSAATVSQLQCIKNQGYLAAFVQAYTPTNGGTVNTAACQTIINANSAGLGTEIYVTPSIGSKSGQVQFDEAYNNLRSGGITVSSIWLQVTSPVNWNLSTATNVALIQSFVSRATSYGVTVGIYTNWYDWQQITGASTAFRSQRLWYWNALGQGTSAESVATFDDFRPFGGWTSASVKQFALNEYLCTLTLNRDVYPSGTKNVGLQAEVKEGVFVAGGFV